MSDPKEAELVKAILTVLETERGGLYPEEIRKKLDGYRDGEVRYVVSRLWDQGKVNLGLDRKLRLIAAE
jgi:hypothetical protein